MVGVRGEIAWAREGERACVNTGERAGQEGAGGMACMHKEECACVRGKT